MEFKSAETFSKAIRDSSRDTRSVPEFLAWMSAVSEARRNLHQLDRDEAYKLKDFHDPWKPFLEELFPLSNWLRSRTDVSRDVRVQPTMKSVPPDATLLFPDGAFLNVEVVKKRDGWLEDLNHESLKRFGGAALTPKDGVQGVKAALAEGKLAEMEARNTEETFAKFLDDVQTSIEDKASKPQYKCLQPISLLTVADDTLSADLERFAAAINIPASHPFHEIYLVSTLRPKSIRVFPGR